MCKQLMLSTLVLAAGISFTLAGCGDSTPSPEGGPAPAPASTAPVATDVPAAAPEHAAFVAMDAGALGKAARVSPDCNLDAIDNQPVRDASFDHTAKPLFSGWVADSTSGSVPATAKLVLRGPQDFAIELHTGSPKREDVAKAMKLASFTNAGYQVYGDLSAVPAGTYAMSMLSTVGGQTLRCDISTKVSVQ